MAAIYLRTSSTEITACDILPAAGPFSSVHDLKANEVNNSVRKRTMIRWCKGAIGVAKV